MMVQVFFVSGSVSREIENLIHAFCDIGEAFAVRVANFGGGPAGKLDLFESGSDVRPVDGPLA